MSVTQDAASPVGRRGWRGMSGWAKVGAGGFCVAALAAVVILPGLGGSGGRPKEDPARTADAANVKLEPFDPAARPSKAGGSLPVGGQATPGRVHRLPAPLEIGSYVVTPPPAVAHAPAARAAYASPQGAPQGGSGAEGGVSPVVYPGAAVPPLPPPTTDNLDGQTSGATMLQASTAGILRHPDFTITAGAKIPCLPVEAADSSLGGFYSCRVPEWVRGTTETRGLLPPGTLIFGKVQQGLEQGQERLGIIYTRIETAGDHVVIRLAAPAADAIGRPGVDGDLHTFFWDRLGAVALYSLLEGVQNGITQGVSSGLNSLGGGNNTFLNFGGVGGGGGQSLAQAEFQHQLQRKPVLRRDQALPQDVSVGQDLDFYAACQTRMRVNPMACPAQ